MTQKEKGKLRFTLRMPFRLDERVTKKANEDGISKNAFILGILKVALEEQKKPR